MLAVRRLAWLLVAKPHHVPQVDPLQNVLFRPHQHIALIVDFAHHSLRI